MRKFREISYHFQVIHRILLCFRAECQCGIWRRTPVYIFFVISVLSSAVIIKLCLAISCAHEKLHEFRPHKFFFNGKTEAFSILYLFHIGSKVRAENSSGPNSGHPSDMSATPVRTGGPWANFYPATSTLPFSSCFTIDS